MAKAGVDMLGVIIMGEGDSAADEGTEQEGGEDDGERWVHAHIVGVGEGKSSLSFQRR